MKPRSVVEVSTRIPPALKLARAVLIYSRGRTDSAFATVHDCAELDGKPVILAGRAMSPSMSRSLVTTLGRGGEGGYLPENVLMADGEYLVWHERPQVRHLAFKASTEFPERSLGDRAGKVPVPGTVFVAGPRAWVVYAYKGTQRPTPDTALFHAPFYNVGENGAICAGNVSLPRSTAAERIVAWNDAFFRSYFAHANYDGVVNFPGDVTGLWTALLGGAFRRFPEKVLKPHKLTLGDLIQQLRRR
jgi:PRTRC genetic system protein B